VRQLPSSPEAPAERKPNFRRRLRLLGLAALVLIIGLVVKYLLDREPSKRRVREAVSRLDEVEPNWRLDELEATRAPVPDEVNGALCVQATASILGDRWDVINGEEVIWKWSANERLPDDLLHRIADELVWLTPAVAAALPLKDREAGRFPPVSQHHNPLETLYRHLHPLRGVGRLLRLIAYHHCWQGEYSEALHAVRGVVNSGRALGDEPPVISQLTRMSCVGLGCEAAQHVLGQGEPGPRELAALQGVLEKESAFRPLEVMLKGDRAMAHQVCELLGNGELTLSELKGPREKPTWDEHVLGFRYRQKFREWHLEVFPIYGRALEIARMPMHERGPEMERHEKSAKAKPSIVTLLLMPGLAKLERSDRHQHALVRCTIVALAAERHRRQKGDWPVSLDALAELVPEECRTDPCSGRPLLLKRTADGLLVYSVGADGEDNGGKQGEKRDPGTDIVFQLWDVTSRGRKATK
jgi:hypothetical protein